jgi:hypothetical protein
MKMTFGCAFLQICQLQAKGCDVDLDALGKAYHLKKRLCEAHMRVSGVMCYMCMLLLLLLRLLVKCQDMLYKRFVNINICTPLPRQVPYAALAHAAAPHVTPHVVAFTLCVGMSAAEVNPVTEFLRVLFLNCSLRLLRNITARASGASASSAASWKSWRPSIQTSGE